MPDFPSIIYASWQEYANALRVAWAGIPGLGAVRIKRAKDGRPFILAVGPSARPSAQIPAAMQAAVGAYRYVLPVLWQRLHHVEKPVERATAEQNLPLHQSMWDGAPPVHDRFMPEIAPDPHKPIIPMGSPTPPAPCEEYQCFLPAHDPQLPFWSRGFDEGNCVCCGNFGISNPAIVFPVPSDQMLTIRTISYWAYGVNVGDRIRIRVTRSGEVMAAWDDQVLAPLTGTASQFAFAGDVRPMPLNLICDHDDTLAVSVTPLGPMPYIPDVDTPSNVQVCVLVGGWITTLNDRRQGAPKSYDLGDISAGAFGDLDVVGEFRDAALVDAVKRLVEHGPCPGSPP